MNLSENTNIYSDGDSFIASFPFEIVKATDGAEDQGEMRLRGVAATNAEDLDGEILEPDGFDLTYLNKYGFANWHHSWEKEPWSIVGQTDPVKTFVKDNKMQAEVVLYKNNELAKKVYGLAKAIKESGSDRQLRFSIEGKKVLVDPRNKKRVLRAVITGLAITPMPKNAETYAEIVKGVRECQMEVQTGEDKYVINGSSIELIKGQKEVDASTKHPDKLGEGAEKRKDLKPKDKFHAVMKEFASGTLHSGSGDKVEDRDQALAIAYSESGLEKSADLEGEIEKAITAAGLQSSGMVREHIEGVKAPGQRSRIEDIDADVVMISKALEQGRATEEEARAISCALKNLAGTEK